jgi:hypothetical protein
MTSMKALLAGLGIFASASFAADRVQPFDLGLSVWKPGGWLLERLDGTSNTRYYTMYDSTLRDTIRVHNALFEIEVFSGILSSGATSRQWVREEAYSRELDLQGACFSTLLSSDTMSIDGVFAREIYGRAAICDSTNLLGMMEDRYIRVTANGDIGWVMMFTGDTADVDTAATTYLSIMDSIQLDFSFASLPYVGAKHRIQSSALRRVVAEGAGLRLNLGSESTPRIEVMDLQGRILSGRIEPGLRGSWVWRPDAPVSGMVAVRGFSGTSQWMDRAVLRR